MSIETRANWTDLVGGVGLDIAEVFDQGQEEYTPGIFQVLIKTSGVGAQRNYSGKTGSGELRKFDGDGDDIGTSRRYKTYTTKVLYTNYGQSIDVSKNQIEDRDFDSALDEMKDMSKAANFSQDKSGMQLFNGGFATTVSVNGYDMTWYGDGKPQFSTVHPTVVPGGSTQSNASSTGIKFSDDNLETARVALSLQKTDDGVPITLQGKETVIVPMVLEKQALQVTMSDGVSSNANNNINIYKGRVNVISSLFLDSTNGGSNNAWFVIVPGQTKLYHEVRQAPKLEQEVNIKNKIATFTVDARWANFSKDWRRSWASKGDLATYSS